MQEEFDPRDGGHLLDDDNRVLYVDDDERLRRMVARTLFARGIGVDTASSRSEALTFARNRIYPVILTDLLLREVDGVTLAHELRSLQPDASFIVTTGMEMQALGSGGLEDSVEAYLKKPWSDQQLSAAVESARDSYRIRCSSHAPVQRYSVLLLEDNAADAHSTRALLDQGGLCSEIAECTRLEQALALLRGRSFDAVIADLGLPDARGLVTVEQVRAVAPDTALIMLSRFEEDTISTQAVRLGAQDCLIKARADVELMRRSLLQAVERKRHERGLSQVAEHDPLTHLMNRDAFSSKLEETAAHSRRTGRHCAVMLLELARFDEVAEQHGDEAGDTVLAEIARRISASVREEDTVSRFGDDGFGILVDELDDPHACTYVAQRLQQITSMPILLGDELHTTIQVHIGIALCPDLALSGEALLSAAGAALQFAKSEGNAYHVHALTDAAPPTPKRRVV